MTITTGSSAGAHDRGGPPAPDLVESAAALAPLVAAHAGDAAAARQLPARLVEAMRDAGLFRIWVPRAFGGRQAGFREFVDVVSAVARVDGSAGWVLFVHGVYGALAAYLEKEAAAEIYGDPTAIVAGSLNPTGRATAVNGGFRVSGRWTFGSGVTHATWVLGNCVTETDGQPPGPMLALFPAADVEVHDTWHVSGLAGTGSHDYSVEDLFVPARYTFPGFSARPRHPGALYAAPFITLFAATVAAPALGMARGAVDAAVDLAARKTPTGGNILLRDRPSAQAGIARAEGLLQAGRAGLIEAVEQMLNKAQTGAASLHDRALVRIAAAHAANASVAAVDTAFDVAGSTANQLDSPLQAFSRDVRAAAQHIAVVANNYELAGRVLLGLDPGTPRF